MTKTETRKAVLKRLEKQLKSGKGIGVVDVETLEKLISRLKKDKEQWFPASMQLFQADFITEKEYFQLVY
jgi:hypothetical protein